MNSLSKYLGDSIKLEGIERYSAYCIVSENFRPLASVNIASLKTKKIQGNISPNLRISQAPGRISALSASPGVLVEIHYKLCAVQLLQGYALFPVDTPNDNLCTYT